MTPVMSAVMTTTTTEQWIPVCASTELIHDRGVCAVVGERHVALFRLSGSGELVAIDNVDPFTGASVLSRGLVGSVEIDGGSVAYVASPLRKQRFDLRTGTCLDDPDVRVDRFEVHESAGRVAVRTSHGSEGTGSSWSNVRETGA